MQEQEHLRIAMSEKQSVALFTVHCLDDDAGGLVAGDPRGGSKKRMDAYTEHKVRTTLAHAFHAPQLICWSVPICHQAYQGATASPSSQNYIKKIAAG